MDRESTATATTNIRNDVEYVRLVPNKDTEFKRMMLEDEERKEQNKTLDVDDDWSFYDGQYPRLGPIVFHNKENASSSADETDQNVSDTPAA